MSAEHSMSRLLSRSTLTAAVLAAGAGLSPGGQAVAQERYASDYSFTYLGFPVARARFTTTIDGQGRAAIDGTVSSAGIARLFDRTEGTTSARAAAAGDGLRPSRFDVDYRSGSKAQRVAIRFSGDRASSELEPPMRARRDDWIPVTEAHLRGVADPLTATLIRADSAETVCGRTISVFDGWMRSDLTLEPAGTGRLEGFEGTTATCRGRFEPISGYRSGSRDIAYMRDRADIRITFAQLGTSGYYVPVDAAIGSRAGTIRVRATKFGGA
jgi:hypothetical protein